MKKIAFLLLIYDTIINEDLWNSFFLDINPDLYTIYIHYKDNVPLKFFEKYKIKECIETKYADVSLIHAQNILLREALCDIDNYKFIFISQSCIPLKPFDTIYTCLTLNDLCHFSKMDGNVTTHTSMCISYYPTHKAAQWCILNRNLATIFSNNSVDMINMEYSNIFAPEEWYYLTYIYKYALEEQIVLHDNTTSTTFTNWGHPSYKYNRSNTPKCLKTFRTIFPNELSHLIMSPHLFARKFNCPLSNFSPLITTFSSASKPLPA